VAVQDTLTDVIVADGVVVDSVDVELAPFPQLVRKSIRPADREHAAIL
jgi:hypothetical protein